MIFVNEYQILSLLFMLLTFLSLHMIFLYLCSLLSSFTYMLGLWILARKQATEVVEFKFTYSPDNSPDNNNKCYKGSSKCVGALSKFEFPCTSKLLGLLCKTSKTEELSQWNLSLLSYPAPHLQVVQVYIRTLNFHSFSGSIFSCFNMKILLIFSFKVKNFSL